METSHFLTPAGPTALGLVVAVLAALFVPAAQAAAEEDSLVCAKVKDSYAASAYKAAFWPRSESRGEMTWCDMKVKAVEHCVPAEAVLHDTSAPYEGYRGPTVRAEYTCYKIRCRNGEDSAFMGTSVPLRDTFGERVGDQPRVKRVCLPNW